MENILITGGAGFIGSNVALALLAKGYGVTVLDNLSPQIHGDNPPETSPLFRSISGKVNFVPGDVREIEVWQKLLKNHDTIIHLASETGTGQSMYQIHKYTEVNIGGTANMLHVLMNTRHTVKKVVLASSRAIYGEGAYRHPKLGIVFPKARRAEDMSRGDFEVRHVDNEVLRPLPTGEDAKIQPASIYGITKQNQEQMLLTVCDALCIPAIALRYQNVYGEGQSLLNPYTGILSIFSNQILSGNPINVFEDGKESRDFIHIQDAVDATIKSIENDSVVSGIFNIGTGVATSILTVAQKLVALFQKEVPIEVSGHYRLGDIRHNFADISKATDQLRFHHKISFDTGVARLTEWVSGQLVQDNCLSGSIAEMSSRGLFFKNKL